MMRRKNFKPAVLAACLLAFMSSPVFGLHKQRVFTQGNNVGLVLDVLVQPMNASTHNSYKPGRHQHSFPRGSGNYYGYLIHSFSPTVSRDCDGDGVAEDTVRIYMRGKGCYGANCSIESYDELKALHDQGVVMEVYARDIERNRMYTSNDPEDVSDWPVEFREGRSPDGEPIIYGAETVVGRYGDCWRDRGIDLPIGFSAEYSWYFLDYGAANNMVFSHVLMRNVSEYLKWCDMQGARELVTDTPEGQVWHDVGLCLAKHSQYMGSRSWRSSRMVYLYNKAENLSGFMDSDGIVEPWTPQTAPVIAEKMLRAPSFNGETMENIFCHVCKGTDFGTELVNDFLENAKPPGVMLRAYFGDESLYPGVINPWTGRQTAGGWPGVILPEDEFYDKWIWGGANPSGPGHIYLGWGMLHDVAPRDTFSLDWVHMCVPMDETFEVPPREVQYIHDESIQAHLEPVVEYGRIAQAVYEGGYVLPETPVPPPLTIIPGDREVTITWSDINIKTPDSYYYFLEENDLNPDGVYREYDFEGYRLYRSYVGPNDSHSELVLDCSLSDGNVQCFYVDRLEDDVNYNRMMNGLKVWYALVPYDRNYDLETGEEFSLPDPESGKVWNRPTNTPGLYSVMPRTDASNYVPASGQWSFTPGISSVEIVEGETAELSADGNGKLVEPPVYLAPAVNITVHPVTNEKITQDQSLRLVCTGMDGADWGGCNYPTGLRYFDLLDSGGAVISKDLELDGVHQRGGQDQKTIIVHGPIDDTGVSYALSVDFDHVSQGDWRENIYFDYDAGSYNGAYVSPALYRCAKVIGSAPNVIGWTKNARYTITWKDAGAGMLTLEVTDDTRGTVVPFGEQPDDYGWGFAAGGDISDRRGAVDNLFNQMVNEVPKSERTTKMEDTISADNTGGFGIWLNGVFWLYLDPAEADGVERRRNDAHPSDIQFMPSAGEVHTATTVWGSWNSDKTAWIQTADVPYPGDSWQVDIKAMSMEAEDADLSKIRVVPNPYVCSSFLDLSPSSRRIEFINLPDRCTIRIYTLSGNLVNVLNHVGHNRLGWGDYTDWDNLSDSEPREFQGWDNHSGTEPWNLRNRFGTTVASGLYLYHVTDERGESHTGKFYVVN